MKKEFENNKKNALGNNPDLRDDIDDEMFQKILREEFIEREKQIEEALFADKDVENLVSQMKKSRILIRNCCAGLREKNRKMQSMKLQIQKSLRSKAEKQESGGISLEKPRGWRQLLWHVYLLRA